ncbi:helix-turn-helix domain-containing protein [Pseudomaricurvus alkylphenolicus]|uniref:helix-turn-helix domain-containing protein n=1 Tax=Pseudomaricurvus alkylphenolicus TaxID=1306991 RepID=UPI001F0DF6D3|nr:helix-turn-helix transcriptional regulator [Pseudomaricurvus alkylphenolicus]
MDQLFIAALAFSFSQILLSALLLLRSQRDWSVQQWLFAVMLTAVTGYLLVPLADGRWGALVVTFLQTLVPGSFWLFSASLFEERFQLKPWKLILVGTTVVLPTLGSLLTMSGAFVPKLLFWTLPQALEFVLLGLAIWSIIHYWRDDLVEARRDLRLWFCGLLGLYILTLLLFRELIFPGAEWLPLGQYLPVGGMLLMTNALLLEYKSGILHPAEPKPPIAIDMLTEAGRGAALAEEDFVVVADNEAREQILPSKPPTEVESADESGSRSANTLSEVPDGLLEQLTHLMERDFVYREMGLTIGQLANRLELPEYRLRKIINAGLGYRNFNDFLNTYRIREASQRLADPDEREVAVLTIALDIGFRSLSSFNKAFKDSLGQTPTEYRADKIPAAAPS